MPTCWARHLRFKSCRMRSGKLVLLEESDARWVFYPQLFVKCTNSNCEEETFFHTSKLRQIPCGRSHEVDRCVVFAMAEMGCQGADLERFCTCMNIPPPMNDEAWQLPFNAIADATEAEAQASMERAGEKLKKSSGRQCWCSHWRWHQFLWNLG